MQAISYKMKEKILMFFQHGGIYGLYTVEPVSGNLKCRTRLSTIIFKNISTLLKGLRMIDLMLVDDFRYRLVVDLRVDET